MRRYLFPVLCFAPGFALASFLADFLQAEDTFLDSLAAAASLLLVSGVTGRWPGLRGSCLARLRMEGFRAASLKILCGYVPPFLYLLYIFLASREPQEMSFSTWIGDSAGQVFLGLLAVPSGALCLGILHCLLFFLAGMFRRG